MLPTSLFDLLLTEVQASSPMVLEGYLSGATRDASTSSLHNTTRFHQKGTEWLTILSEVLRTLGHRSWMYEEGHRGIFVLETCWQTTSRIPQRRAERAAFCRGYFDADGGMPRSASARLYFQFSQKDRDDLRVLRDHLVAIDIDCGRLHVPSVRADPDYWRFFVRARSHSRFMNEVGAWHPRKREAMSERLRRREGTEGA